jgi:hypothetical protein
MRLASTKGWKVKRSGIRNEKSPATTGANARFDMSKQGQKLLPLIPLGFWREIQGKNVLVPYHPEE